MHVLVYDRTTKRYRWAPRTVQLDIDTAENIEPHSSVSFDLTNSSLYAEDIRVRETPDVRIPRIDGTAVADQP